MMVDTGVAVGSGVVRSVLSGDVCSTFSVSFRRFLMVRSSFPMVVSSASMIVFTPVLESVT